MRRNAILSVASLFFVVSLSGCSLFKKKDVSSETHASAVDTYSAPVYQEPTSEYEPYPDETAQQAAPDSYMSTTSSRFHTVAKSDTLYRLARMYYSDQARWKEIFEANSDQISDPNKIFVGQRLVIP